MLAGVEVVEAALRARVEVVVLAGDLTATEAVTPVGRQRRTKLDALWGHLEHALIGVLVRIKLAADLRAGVLWITLQVPDAAVIPLA